MCICCGGARLPTSPLKVIITEGEAGKLPKDVVDKAMHYLKMYSPDFSSDMCREMMKLGFFLW